MIEKVEIIELAMRDGLQNLLKFIPTDLKIQFAQMLIDAGCSHMEIAACVSPKRVEQMKDAVEVCRSFAHNGNVITCCLIPNLKGLELALEGKTKEIVTVMSASEVHNMANVNRTIKQSLSEISEIAKCGKEAGIRIRASIGTAFGYLGEIVTTDKVVSLARKLKDLGFMSITICDTTGIANPKQVYETCRAVGEAITPIPLGIHLHQAHGIEYANMWAAFDAGVRIFEAAAGGLGGCPFAEGAEGNINTEVIVNMFHRMNIKTGIDLDRINACAEFAKRIQREYAVCC